MNRWEQIKRFYAAHEKLIMQSPSSDWAIPAYSWDDVVGLMTPIEDALWHDLRAANAVFYPQWPVSGFFVDFANPVARVALECDGKAYHTDKEKDAARDRKLADIGWTVYRFPGWLCMSDFDEETMSSSNARKLVDAICQMHSVSRKKQKSQWVTFQGFDKEPA